jgi:hypothetical protein
MPVRSGRLEKRIRIAIPVQISSPLDPAAAERTITENVCSLGIRIFAQRARELNERLLINSVVGDLRTLARVVYCERLPDGRFGVGLQFQGITRWPKDSLAAAADWIASFPNDKPTGSSKNAPFTGAAAPPPSPSPCSMSPDRP